MHPSLKRTKLESDSGSGSESEGGSGLKNEEEPPIKIIKIDEHVPTQDKHEATIDDLEREVLLVANQCELVDVVTEINRFKIKFETVEKDIKGLKKAVDDLSKTMLEKFDELNDKLTPVTPSSARHDIENSESEYIDNQEIVQDQENQSSNEESSTSPPIPAGNSPTDSSNSTQSGSSTAQSTTSSGQSTSTDQSTTTSSSSTSKEE